MQKMQLPRYRIDIDHAYISSAAVYQSQACACQMQG